MLIPVLGKRPLVELVQSKSRSQREMDAISKLRLFRENARKRAAFRMWRQAKVQFGFELLGKVSLINFNHEDADVIRTAIPLFCKNLNIKIPFGVMVISSDTNLRDAQGSIRLMSGAGELWWAQAWRQGRTKLVCISFPRGFGSDELLFGNRNDAPIRRLRGRAALIHYLLVDGFHAIAEWENPRGFSRRLAKWKVHIDTDPELRSLRIIEKLCAK